MVGEERRAPSVCEGWKRVGVERREEKERDESTWEAVLGCCGIWANLYRAGYVSSPFGSRLEWFLVGLELGLYVRIHRGAHGPEG